jgi:hypothetical protein
VQGWGSHKAWGRARRRTDNVGDDPATRGYSPASAGGPDPLETMRLRVDELAEEKLALCEVAALVVGEDTPALIFPAMAREMCRVLHSDYVMIKRYGPGRGTTLVGRWDRPGAPELCHRSPLDDDGPLEAQVARTGRPARRTFRAGHAIRWPWTHSFQQVAWPVFVNGWLWGLVADVCCGSRPQPDGTEERMAKFVELLGTVIACSECHEGLLTSRARLLAAFDATRRHVEHRLHDGVQQRLVVLSLELRSLRDALDGELRERVTRMEADLAGAMAVVGELSRGLYPAGLTHGGLQTALKTLARRSPLPVELSVHLVGEPSESVALAVHSVAAQALANALRHPLVTRACLDIRLHEGTMAMSFYDDGRGAGDIEGEQGLAGLRDRVEALGGELTMTDGSDGTSLSLCMPG